MNIVFFSNFLNHHQLPFCQAMINIDKVNFKFVATEQIASEQLNLGYADINKLYPFVLTTYDHGEGNLEALKLARESDIAIFGSSPDEYLEERMKYNKFTFRYFERIYKNGVWHLFSPRSFIYMINSHTRYRKKTMYLLCASAYAAYDFSLVGAYKKKTYKWGYFTEVKNQDISNLIALKPQVKMKIIWVGRLIRWKHPEFMIKVAVVLRNQGYNFEINIIGSGALKTSLEKMIETENLKDCVKMLGSMSPDNVRTNMEGSNIFALTSDYNEGWGAVINEAMNSGCAVVASHAVGSVPYLLRHKANGLIFRNRDVRDLIMCIKEFINDKSLREMCSYNAYKTLADLWNPECAATRLLKLYENIKLGKETEFLEGPCSRAEIIPERKMYSHLINKRTRKGK